MRPKPRRAMNCPSALVSFVKRGPFCWNCIAMSTHHPIDLIAFIRDELADFPVTRCTSEKLVTVQSSQVWALGQDDNRL
jgi:hypothetical protein